MTASSARPPGSSRRAERFTYERFEIDPARSQLRCHYSLDGEEFCETVTMAGVDSPAWGLRGVLGASLWVFLLLGLSYYKAGAPRIVSLGDLGDLGDIALTEPDLDFLRECYLDGLGEFAFRNGLDLSDLVIETRPAVAPQPYPEAVPAARIPGSRTGQAPTGEVPAHGRGGELQQRSASPARALRRRDRFDRHRRDRPPAGR